MAGRKTVEYESILEQLHREYGESYRTDFSNDKAQFNLPPLAKPLTEAQQSVYDSPVGGRTRDKQQAGDKQQFSDENTQLSVKASSTIQSAAYFTKKEYLVVSFKSGHTYSYSGVPVAVVRRWEGASSAGSYFYYNIRTSFSYQKLG
jgi:hypothetical protein